MRFRFLFALDLAGGSEDAAVLDTALLVSAYWSTAFSYFETGTAKEYSTGLNLASLRVLRFSFRAIM